MTTPSADPLTTVSTTVELETAPEKRPRRRRRGRRGNHEGSIVKRADGRWAGAVTVGLGKRRWVYGKTRDEVTRRITNALKSAQDGVPIPGDVETVGGFLTRWLTDTVPNRVRPVTLASYTGLIRLHVLPTLGPVRLVRLTPAQVQALLNKKLADGLSPRTVEYLRSVLRQALNHAVRWGLVTRNVAALTDRPQPVRREIRPFDREQAQRFLAAIRGDRLEALYAVALGLGLRQGEVLGLRWEDVDLNHGFLHVRRSLMRIGGEFVLGAPKTTRSVRTLGPLPATLIASLRAHRARQTAEQLAAPTWHNQWGLVFTTPTGSPLHSKSIATAFQAHVSGAGLPRQRFHDLRHGCASLLMAQGVHPRVVMELLGHTTIGTTMNIYSHVAESAQRDALAGLSASLSGAALH